MLFCPNCSNNLMIDSNAGGRRIWVCPTCPYKWEIQKQITMRTHLKRKEVDDVMGGKESWANVDRTETTCPQCDHRLAYFRQLQIRSADEPMTTFYKCCECSFQWREN